MEERRPEEVGIGFDKDVPLHVRKLMQRSVYHRQELPLVKLPAWVLEVPLPLHCLLGKPRRLQLLSPRTLKLAVQFELGIAGEEIRADVFDGVEDVFLGEILFVVGEDYTVWVALHCC